MLSALGASRSSILTVTAHLRHAELGVGGFAEAWREWLGGDEVPGIMVLQVQGWGGLQCVWGGVQVGLGCLWQ